MPISIIPDLVRRQKELEHHLRLLFNRSCQWSRAERVRGASTIENLTQQLVEITDQIDTARGT